MRMFHESSRPWLNADAPSGGGEAPTVTTESTAVDTGADPITTVPVSEPSHETANLAEMTRQLMSQQEAQRAMLEEMRSQFAAANRPRPEDDLRTDEQRRLDEIADQTRRLSSYVEQQENERYSSAATTHANNLLDRLVASDPLVKANPKMSQAIRAEINAILTPIVRANPKNHGITEMDVKKWFNEKARVYREVHESWPGQAAAVATAQAQINAKAVDAGTGSSPSPTDAKPEPEAGTEAWWDAKRTKIRAAIDRHAGAQ